MPLDRLARGKVRGGASFLDALLDVRGRKEDCDRWRQMEHTGWGWQDVLPLFKRAENNERGGDDHHGDQGPLAVPDRGIMQRPICDAWVAAAQAAGDPFNPDCSAKTQEGAACFQLIAKKWAALQRGGGVSQSGQA